MVRSSCSSSLLTKIIRYAHYGFIKGNISSSVSNHYTYNIQSSQIIELELPSFRPVPLDCPPLGRAGVVEAPLSMALRSMLHHMYRIGHYHSSTNNCLLPSLCLYDSFMLRS